MAEDGQVIAVLIVFLIFRDLVLNHGVERI
jgi:hypothetical protein